MALRESPMIPGLEGSTHINFRLTVQFIDNYFAEQKGVPGPNSATLSSNEPPENSYWLGVRDRHAKTVQFDSFLAAYEKMDHVQNVRLFVVQAKAFREWITGEARPIDLAGDAALSVAVGRCFSIIVYAQLVAENAIIAKLSPSTISLMFHGLVQDLTAETMQIMSVYRRKSPERLALSKVVRVPHTSFDDGESVFQLCSARYH
jgi:acyl-CoA dehydrogenase